LLELAEDIYGIAAMRIAAINSHPIQYFAPLWREIAKTTGVDFKVFYCCDWGVADYKDAGFGKVVKWDVDLRGGYESEILPIRKRPKALGFWQVDNPIVTEALSHFRPDILLLFGYSHLTIWRALLWARLNRVRTLIFSDSELKHPRKRWVRVAKQVLVRAFFSQLDGALPISSANAAYYLNYGLPRKRLHPCAQPIDGERFMLTFAQKHNARATVRRSLNIGQNAFVFAAVGKYVEKKRTTDVVKAWLDLDSSLKARSYLLLIGEGELRPKLQALANLPDSHGRVILTGFVNQQDLPALYAACDATVLASDVEPHGQVITESLFLGIPAIASDRVGCVGREDILRDGETGLVYPHGDTKALAIAMAAMMRDSAQYRHLSEGARAMGSEQDARVVASQFIQAFKHVLHSPRPSLGERARTVVPFLAGRA
jgi:glycosyltransferase involved in cell wall biosynthesis